MSLKWVILGGPTFRASESWANILISKVCWLVALRGFLWNQCDMLTVEVTVEVEVEVEVWLLSTVFLLCNVASVVSPPADSPTAGVPGILLKRTGVAQVSGRGPDCTFEHVFEL